MLSGNRSGNPRSYIPYENLLTHIFRHFGVNLKNEQVHKDVSRTVFDKAVFARMKISSVFHPHIPHTERMP